MVNIKDLLPIGLIAPFLIIIAIELIIGFGMDFYTKKLNNQIAILENEIKQKEENLMGGLNTNPSYKVFSQVVNITEILKNRKSLNFVINKFNQLMPKFLIINSFNYNTEKQEIEISVSLQNWQDYFRFYRYLKSLKELEIKSISNPQMDKNNLINFSVVLLLKPNFY
jgi:hypothetical protein